MKPDVIIFRLEKTLEEFLQECADEMARALKEEGNGHLEITFVQGATMYTIQKEITGDRTLDQ